MIIILDYGMGNTASVFNMVRKIGGMCKISNDKSEIFKASKLILPGVGSFNHGVRQLQSCGFFDTILHIAKTGIPILGICLGMQLLSKKSEEGNLNGLSLIDAEFRKFSLKINSLIRIPHVGWNTIKVVKENQLIPFDEKEKRFYFTHSYHAVCNNPEDIIATAVYGYEFVCAYRHKNIYGVQFHPEKSHRFGMEFMKRFCEI